MYILTQPKIFFSKTQYTCMYVRTWERVRVFAIERFSYFRKIIDAWNWAFPDLSILQVREEILRNFEFFILFANDWSSTIKGRAIGLSSKKKNSAFANIAFREDFKWAANSTHAINDGVAAIIVVGWSNANRIELPINLWRIECYFW